MIGQGGHGQPTLATYFSVFAALMVFTALTAWAAFQHLGAWNTPAALAIAVTKAALVVLFFMHVRYSTKLTGLVIGTSVLFLLILFVITLSDYLSRGWLPIYHR